MSQESWDYLIEMARDIKRTIVRIEIQQARLKERMHNLEVDHEVMKEASTQPDENPDNVDQPKGKGQEDATY